ncbi:MAG TPA: choloylglycine hydrolase family protein [Candidatus Pullilachnospira intestinigallinarum]|nr:choloylglycine hydrolase family protein [Candidatus Pullilachnospira intestinigallinarum]
MCTCITYENGDFYFGRNLDLEYHFGEQVVITPRNYSFRFCREPQLSNHYAMIGMASVEKEYPLYAEAVNEKGLGMAGLNFPENACYVPEQPGKKNVTPWELIPWVLGQCANLTEARNLLGMVSLLHVPFAEALPLAPLHWMLADRSGCLVLEADREGVHLYDNPFGVLTNNPPFPYYLEHMRNYVNLRAEFPGEGFARELNLSPFGQGMGAMGLPGDFSPASRFVKAAFLKWNSQASGEGLAPVSQFFHILEGVAMVRGSVITPEGVPDVTTYSCCVNADRGIYYYKTYDNSQIQAVSMEREALDGMNLRKFPLVTGQKINWQN